MPSDSTSVHRKPQTNLSVVIPTLNEADNIDGLVERLAGALGDLGYQYELIFIDDHSSDATLKKIRSYGSSLPLKVWLKDGEPGKGYSLIQGFKRARYDLIVMIDADLQYPPEAIPEMVTALHGDIGIVVANRVNANTGFARRQLSQLGRNVYGKWMHGLDCDVQSGLKLFRREILAKVRLAPTAWAFDLDFLVQAKDAGYAITTIDISFSERAAGSSHVNVFKTGTDIFVQALRVKLHRKKIAQMVLSRSMTTHTEPRAVVALAAKREPDA